MKIGVFTALLSDQSLENAVKYLKELNVDAVELSTGGYAGKSHLNPDLLLNNKHKIKELKEMLNNYNMEISGLSCHGNPVHPQKKIADKAHKDFEKAVLLAEKLEIDRVITFSGCPGGSSKSIYPNWVTCPWPDDYSKILEYQWDEVLIPYWKEAASFAKKHSINKIALEMHPGFCVYNPETLLKLRKAVGNEIGANFDPSHLFWQGIDPVAAIRKLGASIYHFHAKDTKIDKLNSSVNGVLDTKHYSDEINRSWIFRSVGYGHGYQIWKDMISNLKMIGYDDVLSIEHEDSLMSTNEGLKKAVSFLKEVTTYEDTSKMWWA